MLNAPLKSFGSAQCVVSKVVARVPFECAVLHSQVFLQQFILKANVITHLGKSPVACALLSVTKA